MRGAEGGGGSRARGGNLGPREHTDLDGGVREFVGGAQRNEAMIVEGRPGVAMEQTHATKTPKLARTPLSRVLQERKHKEREFKARQFASRARSVGGLGEVGSSVWRLPLTSTRFRCLPVPRLRRADWMALFWTQRASGWSGIMLPMHPRRLVPTLMVTKQPSFSSRSGDPCSRAGSGFP